MKIYKAILQKLSDDLEMLEQDTEDVLERAEKGEKLSRIALQNLRKKVLKKGFTSARDEIIFFKKIKPRLCSKPIYYAKLFNIETKRPRGSNKSQIKYLNDHIRKLQDYFNDNLEFYHYYRRNATCLDNQYFLRGKTDVRLRLNTYFYMYDEEFTTGHDNTIAIIMAYDTLIVYLKKEIEKIEFTNNNEIRPNLHPTNLFWTANKTDLVELIYALHSSGAINHGAADIKVLASMCEHIFSIDLGNFYHTYVEIRARKSNNTKFLDLLKEALLKRYEESDE